MTTNEASGARGGDLLAGLVTVAERGPAHGGPLVAAVHRHRALRGVRPEEERDDVAQTVALKLLCDAPRIVLRLTAHAHSARALDLRLDAYVRRMIVHQRITAERRARRLRPFGELPDLPDPRATAEPAREAAAFDALQLALDRARTDTSVWPALQQVLDLCLGNTTMAALARADLSPRAAETHRVRVRDRLLRRHSRARARLVGIIADLVREGLVEPEIGRWATHLVEGLLRRRQVRGPIEQRLAS